MHIASVHTTKCRSNAYSDENGRKWHNGYCPDCKRILSIKSKRKSGVLPRNENHPYKIISISSAAEKMVAEFYESIGYTCKLTTTKGPDIIATDPNGKSITIEVKLAHEIITKRGLKQYIVGMVRKDRKNDDFIAIVFNDKRIFIEPMSTHLSKCFIDNSRSVTELIRPLRKNQHG